MYANSCNRHEIIAINSYVFIFPLLLNAELCSRKNHHLMNSLIVSFSRAGQPLSTAVCEIPQLTEGQVLVANEYTTLCRSNISTYQGRRIEKSPTILGHEIVGRIVAFGPGQPARDAYGRPLHVGDRITWAIYAACPDGPMARRGIPQKAADLFKYGHEQLRPDNTLHGGLATHTLLRRHTPILPLPDEVPLPAAAIINCAVSTVAGSLRLAGELKGRRVALWGIGMLGTIACAMCSEAGAAEIIALDVNPERLAHARRFGATATLRPDDPAAAALQADVTIDYSGYGTAMEASVDALATGGTAVWVGGVCPQDRVRIDAEQLIRHLRTVRGLHNYNTDDFKTAVAFITTHGKKYPFADLVYDGFTLSEAEQAFAYAIDRNPYRVGIRIHHQNV